MNEIDEIAKEIKRLSDEVLLLTGLVYELRALVEQKIGIVRQLKFGSPQWYEEWNGGRLNL